MFLNMNWSKIGSLMAPHLVSILISLGVVLLAWRKFMLPEIEGTLKEAQKTISTLAGLGGLRKSEWQDGAALEKAVGAEIIGKQIPELEALKLILDTGTWEKIEDAIENNPAAVIQMYEKWKHLIPGASQSSEKFDF